MGFVATQRVATVLPARIPSLDGLRAISIGLVLPGHLAGTDGFPVSHATGAFLDLGGLGVRAFFVISGFRLGMWDMLPALRVGMGHRFEIIGDAIATGCVLAGIDTWLRRRAHYTRFLTSRLFVLVPIAVVVIGAFHGRPRVIAVLASLANVGIALCIHRAVLHPADGVGRLLNSRPFVWVGTISYSLYLWQQLFLDRTASGWAVEFPVNLGLAVTAATVS